MVCDEFCFFSSVFSLKAPHQHPILCIVIVVVVIVVVIVLSSSRKKEKKKNDVTKNEKWPFAFKLFFKNSYYRFKVIYFSDGNDGQLFWSLGSSPRPSNNPRGMYVCVGVTSSLPTTTTYIITWFPPLPAQPKVTAIMFVVFKFKSQNNMTCFSHAREEILCFFLGLVIIMLPTTFLRNEKKDNNL